MTWVISINALRRKFSKSQTPFDNSSKQRVTISGTELTCLRIQIQVNKLTSIKDIWSLTRLTEQQRAQTKRTKNKRHAVANHVSGHERRNILTDSIFPTFPLSVAVVDSALCTS